MYLTACVICQVPWEQGQAAVTRGKRSRNGAEGLQGAGAGVLHICVLLGAVLRTEHIIRRVPRVSRAGSRGQHLPLARLRVLNHKSHHLHHLQQNLQERFH